MNPFSPGTRVLVTGATGFIGSHIARAIQEMPGVELICIARKRNENSTAIWLESSLADLTAALWADHKIRRIDVIFHLGAYTPKDSKSADAMGEIFSANVAGTHALLDSLPSSPASIVFSSTLDVYAAGGVVSEDSPLGPGSIYAASKLYGEHVMRAYASVHGSTLSILRYGHIYGPGEFAYQKAIPNFIRALMAGRSPVIVGDGSACRDYLYVDDVVEATVRAAQRSKSIDGPLNIVSGSSVSILEIVRRLLEVSGVNVDIEFQDTRAPIRSLAFDNRKMIETLGEWPLTDLSDGLSAEWEYFRRVQQ